MGWRGGRRRAFGAVPQKVRRVQCPTVRRAARRLQRRCPACAREELCAELASAYLCASLGIVPSVRHADYLGSWLAVLREDSRAIFKAASEASKAADYLLAFAPALELARAA